jgi:hypothetical protein
MSMQAILSLAGRNGKEGFRASGISRGVVRALIEEPESGAGGGREADSDSVERGDWG